MPPTGTPDLLSRGRQTQIMVDYKFIIESPCERDHRRRHHRRRKHRIHLRVTGILSRTRFRKVTESNELCSPSNSNLVTWDT